MRLFGHGTNSVEWAGWQTRHTAKTPGGFYDRQVASLELYDGAGFACPSRVANITSVTQTRFDA